MNQPWTQITAIITIRIIDAYPVTFFASPALVFIISMCMCFSYANRRSCLNRQFGDNHRVTMNRKRLVCVIVLIALVIINLCSCRRGPEEETIRNIITGIQEAAEEKDTSKIMKNVSDTYNDTQGMTHESLKRLLRGYFLVYPKISVYVNYLKVSVIGASASATFQAMLTSGQKKGSLTDVIPQSLGVYRFDVSLAKESGNWKIVSAEWRPVYSDSEGGE